jgi:hypothetical protein
VKAGISNPYLFAIAPLMSGMGILQTVWILKENLEYVHIYFLLLEPLQTART